VGKLMSIQKLISLDIPENWAFPSRALLEIDELQKNVHTGTSSFGYKIYVCKSSHPD
jgi:predicted protein tyrosine phosphatase